MTTNAEILEKLEKTSARVDKLSEDLASHKPISELIKYLLYFWTAISVVLGFFGWSKFAALQDVVADQVRLQLPQSEQQYAKFEELVGKAKKLNSDYETLAGDYEKSVDALAFAGQVGADFDIEGRLTALIMESTRRTADKASILRGEREDLTGTYLDSEWRKRAIATLNTFKEAIEKKSYPADFIFNVTQICRRLEQFELAEKLTTAAFQKDPSPPITALYLSSRVASTQGKDREDAFQQLMNMIDELSQDSPQIVIAEAWNAAEDQRRYGDLIDAIDRRVRKGGFLPSRAGPGNLNSPIGGLPAH